MVCHIFFKKKSEIDVLWMKDVYGRLFCGHLRACHTWGSQKKFLVLLV